MNFAYEMKPRNTVNKLKSETAQKVNWIVLGTRITLDHVLAY